MVTQTLPPRESLPMLKPEGTWALVLVRDWWPFGKRRMQWRFTFARPVGEEVGYLSFPDPPAEAPGVLVGMG